MIKIFCDRCGKECIGKKSSARIQINGGHDLDVVICTDCNDKIREFINIKEGENMSIKTICDICGKEIKSQVITAQKTYVTNSYPIIMNKETIVEHCCEDCREAIDNFINKRKLVNKDD